MAKYRKTNQKFVHIKEVLDGILKTEKQRVGDPLTRISSVWNMAVGDIVGSDAEPAALKGGALLVHVSCSVWMHHLRFAKGEILMRLNNSLGEDLIDEIRLKVGAL